jgi:hypothetical protein
MEESVMDEFKKYIQDYETVDLGWAVKPWFKVDVKKLQEWYTNLETNYSQWKFIYNQHKHMWREDPGDITGKTGHRFMDDTAWYTLCWSTAVDGPLPPERGQAKLEWQDFDDDGLHPRECFDGYTLDIVNNLPIRSKRWIVSIHTPGTKLITHQDSPDKIRLHIPIYTNEHSDWIIDGKPYHMDLGWAYLVNTTLPHSVENNGTTNRVHLYGKVWIDDCKNLF